MSEAEEQAWQKHKTAWPLETSVAPMNHEFGFRLGYRAAQAVSLPDRETLRRAVGGVLWNAANYPRKAQPYLLGTDTAPLTGKVVDAVLAALSTQPAAGVTEDALADLRESIEQELELGGDASTLVPAVTEWLKRTWSVTSAPDTAILAAKAEAWDEACQALAWCFDNGPERDALPYMIEHNPFRAASIEQTEADRG